MSDHNRDLLVSAMERIATAVSDSLAEDGKGEVFLVDTVFDDKTNLPYSILNVRKPGGGVGIFTVKPTVISTFDRPHSEYEQYRELIYQLEMWPRTDPDIPYYMIGHAKRLYDAMRVTLETFGFDMVRRGKK